MLLWLRLSFAGSFDSASVIASPCLASQDGLARSFLRVKGRENNGIPAHGHVSYVTVAARLVDKNG